MLEWMLMPLKRYAEFSGRSRRMEYWSFFLLNLVVTAVLLGPFYYSMISNIMAAQGGAGDPATAAAMASPGAVPTGLAVLGGLWGLGTIIPNIALTVRRLHDRDMSGWWYLGFVVAAFIPLVGLIAVAAYLVIMFLPGTPGPNRFGPDPKGGQTGSEVFS